MAKKHITSLGLDLSLVGTGFVILTDGKIVDQGLIKSKPAGDRPIDELKRIQKIVADIDDNLQTLSSLDIDIAVIEGLAFMAQGTSLVQLAALNYMVRAMLADYGIPFVIVAPTTLKKFIASNGAAKKDAMMLETFKRYGVSILDNNICDAYGLSQVGLALLGGNSKPTTKLQEEVINLLNKQL